MSTNDRFFADQRPPEARRGSASTSGVSGQSTTMINEAAAMQEARERQAFPQGSPLSPQPLSVPKLMEGQKLSSLTDLLGIDPAEEQGQPPVQEGFGPRLVILRHYVTGPRIAEQGGRRTAFTRGQVIWGSQLIGDELMQKALDGDQKAIRELRRYVIGNNPAARQANSAEAAYTQVTFVEGEAALANTLQATQQRVAQVEDENVRMKRIMESLEIDPNASQEEIQAKLSSLRASQVTPPTGSEPPQPPDERTRVTQTPQTGGPQVPDPQQKPDTGSNEPRF